SRTTTSIAAPEPVPIVANPIRGTIATTPSEPDPVVYWDAKLTLAGAGFDTGLVWADVYGSLGCTGRYDGSYLGPVSGAMWFERARVADQPVQRLKASFAA